MRAMLAFILVFCVILSPAQAGPVAVWGTSSATLGRCRDADACVAVVNMLSAAPETVDMALEMDGLVVFIHVEMGAGVAPDTATLILPDGLWAEPASLTIEEGHSAVFRIFFHLVG